LREPYDYYKLGNDYINELVNYDRSVLGQPERWDEMVAQLDRGENVILLANHQSEADAAFIPLLTMKSHPGLGEKVVYVAGARVVGDLMAKPFSMGRNLICVHSKKHMTKETRSQQMRDNIKAIKAMEAMLRAGGCILWIAPSGGRDRRNVDTRILQPDNFDPDVVEMVRKVGTKAGMPPTHYYPFAMATYDVMPPPEQTGGNLGEERNVNYTGVGLSLAEEIDVVNGSWAEGLEDNERKPALAEEAFRRVTSEYNRIEGCMGNSGDFPLPDKCARPWLANSA